MTCRHAGTLVTSNMLAALFNGAADAAVPRELALVYLVPSALVLVVAHGLPPTRGGSRRCPPRPVLSECRPLRLT